MLQIDRVLLVGLGSIGKRHLSNIKRLLPNVSLAVFRSRNGIIAVDGCEVVSSIEEAIAFKPRLALICNPSSFHLDVATELAEAGIHLFIEKPLTNKLKGLAEFAAASRRANIKVMVGYNLRFSPSLLTIREFLQSGRFGRTLCVSAEVGQYLPDWRPDVDYRSTVSAQSELGGGALLELSHELDYLTWIFGEAVFASGQVLKVSDLEIDVEDLVLAHVCFENNGNRLLASIQLDFLQRKPYRLCKVICEHATLTWDAIEDCVVIHQKDETITAFQGDKNRNYTYEQEIVSFIECIATNTPVPISIEDSYRVIKLIEALRVSSDEGKVVYL